MITKKQWFKVCEQIREKRRLGKKVCFCNTPIAACIDNIIILEDGSYSQISHKTFLGQSCRMTKMSFYWNELYRLSDEDKS